MKFTIYSVFSVLVTVLVLSAHFNKVEAVPVLASIKGSSSSSSLLERGVNGGVTEVNDSSSSPADEPSDQDNEGEENIESQQFEGRFVEEGFAAEFSKLDLVPLRLVRESPDGLMFGQIFPIMTVPALYLIRNGLLADFMNGSVDNDEMLERIQKAVQGHFQIPPPPGTVLPAATGAGSTTTTAAAPVASASNNAHVQEESSSSGNPTITTTPFTATPSVPSIAPSTSASAPTATPSALLAQANAAPRAEQAQVMKDLMKERKLKREQEEREAARQREISRRANSKAMSDAQKELVDKQSKKLKDQIEKEKREEAEYKKRVKQALEEDKARRKAEREKAQAALAASSVAYSSPVQAFSSSAFAGGTADPDVVLPEEVRALNSGLREARNDAAPALACDSSRLNIRLFDGSSIRNTFKATDTLEAVREWINQNQEDEDDAYNIVQLIPSRTFTDESKMLRDLELCPSATLVLKRTQTASAAYGPDGGAVPTLLGYGWSALGFAGKMASSALSTVAAYNPLAVQPAPSSPASSSYAAGSSSAGGSSQASRTAA
ncbi:hypothetical protein BGZ83_008966 [Gryganskiella cystojenkinii]|nr:hypothetical protein BGZ83_008966 [Gryganskiella cystojenkinii]